MASLLFGQAFAQFFHQLIKSTCGLDFGHFLGAEVFFSQLFQPFTRNIDGVQNLIRGNFFKPGKACRKGAIIAIKVAFILDHDGAPKQIKGVNIIGGKPRIKRLKKPKIFPQ